MANYATAGVEKEEERELPVVSIYGTQFLVDIKRHEFREVSDPFNRMTLGDVPENDGFYKLFYDTDTKNIYLGSHELRSKFPTSVWIVLVPDLRTLDPVGIAKRQGNQQHNSVQAPAIRELKCLRPQMVMGRKKGRSI